MKRVVPVLLLVLLLAGFVLAQDEPKTPGEDGEDVEKIQKAIDTAVPIGDDGQFNSSGFTPLKSKAELRVIAINDWLEENVSWLRFIFHMEPAISWHFAWNLFFMLFFLYLLVIKGGVTFNLGGKSLIVGGALYIILLAIGIYAALGGFVTNFFGGIFDIFDSPIVSWVLTFIFVIVLFSLWPITKSLLSFLKGYWERKRAYKKEMRQKAAAKIVEKFLAGN